MGKKILLAEDSLTIQKVFELAFARTDVSLTMVDNGTDAVRLATETAPDLVVTDVTLSDKDGFQVAEELRESEKTRACPVLILSGTLTPFDEDRYKKCGANAVLFKPFESQELIEKAQELMRTREEPAPKAKGEAAPAPDEPWDFSDVLDEVIQEGGKAERPPVQARGEELLPGTGAPASKAEGGLALGEFDVSLEELDEPSKGSAGEEAPAAGHVGEEVFTDAPPPVTDLAPAIEAVEDFEEIEELEEMELLQKEAEAPPPPAAPPATPAADTPRPAEPPPVDAAPPPAPPPPPAVAPPAAAADEGALREQFAARAQEIFEKVAAEAVEKVLWEYMERFSGELTARVRESVEAVAWEVIPATAEALIREEIARIRAQAEKKSS